MNYHLHRQGQDPVVLPLEELRRRREAGELTGAELVWKEGMPQWQSLDTILSPRPPFAAPAGSDPAASRARGRIILLAVLVVTLAGVGALVWGAVFLLKHEPPPPQPTVRKAAPSYKPAVEILAPLPTNTLTHRDVRKKERDFRVRQWVDGYKERGPRNHPLDADALRALDGWMANHYGEPGQTNTPVSAIFDKLAAAQDFNDPLVLTLSVDETTPDQVVPRLERAMAAYPGSKHRAYPRLATAVRLIEQTQEAERLNALFATAREAFAESFRDGSVTPEDQSILGEILVHGWGYNHFLYRTPDAVRGVTRQLGPDWRWLHWVVAGEAERTQAWRDRGGGYANTVSDRGWELFASHMIRAQTNFSAAWQLRPELPLAPAQMIDVAMSMADDAEMRRWFKRAVAAQIDYHPAWTSMRWGLRPRWHGNLEKMLAFGVYAVDTGRFDTDVPRKLFDSISDIESEMELPFGVHLYLDRKYWRPLQRMYEGYLAAPTEEYIRPGWRSTYAVVAYLAGQYGEARKQLEALDWKLGEKNLNGWDVDLSLLPLAVAAHTGPLQPKIQEAENSYNQRKVSEAVVKYEALEKDPGSDPRTASYIQHRLATLRLEKRFQDGEWIPLLPGGEDDPTWRVIWGKLRLENQAFVMEPDQGWHLLVSRLQAGMNFELQGVMETLQSANGSFQCGVVMGFPMYGSSDWYGVRLRRNSRGQGQISFSKAWSKQEYVQGTRVDPSTNSMHLKLVDGKLDVAINGEPVLQNQEPNPQMKIRPNNFVVGVGADNDGTGTVVRYRGLRIRKVTN